jgi:hypothetical protein
MKHRRRREGRMEGKRMKAKRQSSVDHRIAGQGVEGGKSGRGAIIA